MGWSTSCECYVATIDYVREKKGAFVKKTHRIKLLEDIGVDLDPKNLL